MVKRFIWAPSLRERDAAVPSLFKLMAEELVDGHPLDGVLNDALDDRH